MKLFFEGLSKSLGGDTPTKPGGGLESLSVGRQVKAQVVGPAPGGKVELALMGARVQAQSQVPLRPGQNLELSVEQTSPQLVLSLGKAGAQGGAKPLPVALQLLLQGRERLIRNLGTVLEFDPGEGEPPGSPLRELLGRAKAAILQASLDPKADQGGEALPRALRASGMNLEAELAQALAQGRAGEAALAGKGSLRIAARLLALELEAGLAQGLAPEPARTAELRDAAQALHGLAQGVEANQQLNAHLLAERNSLFFSLPLLFGNLLQAGEFFFELPEKDQDGRRKGQSTLAFFLNLTGLGQVVIQARMKNQRISGEISVESREKARFLTGLLPELEKALAGLGHEAFFKVLARPEEDLSQHSPLARLLRQSGQYLSLTV